MALLQVAFVCLFVSAISAYPASRTSALQSMFHGNDEFSARFGEFLGSMSKRSEQKAKKTVLTSRCVVTTEYDPVCGTDGVTYANPSEAACSGLIVAFEGDCEGEDLLPRPPMKKSAKNVKETSRQQLPEIQPPVIIDPQVVIDPPILVESLYLMRKTINKNVKKTSRQQPPFISDPTILLEPPYLMTKSINKNVKETSRQQLPEIQPPVVIDPPVIIDPPILVEPPYPMKKSFEEITKRSHSFPASHTKKSHQNTKNVFERLLP